MSFRGMNCSCLAKELSCRPERTRISYYAAPPTATCAAFRKESRMKFADAINLGRKSGVAEWRDLRFPCYSSDSGWSPKPFSPDAFFSFHFFTQASQLAPAARSLPVKVNPAISL